MIFNWKRTENKVDFLAIGDTVINAFIKVKEARVACDANNEHCELSLSYPDKVPYESVEEFPAVGNAANASIAASRLGLKAAFITNIGDDLNGKRCLDHFKKENIGTEYITIHNEYKTNYHYVLWYENDRTILVKHEEYSYKLPTIVPPSWIYLSSLADHSSTYHQEIFSYLEQHPEVQFAFQPGTFQLNLPENILSSLLKRTNLFVCNFEEAQRLLNTQEEAIQIILAKIKELGPKIVVITNGPKGAYSFDGERTLFLEAFPDQQPPIERTGAGDAFAGTVASALALGKNLNEALQWGAINAMSVVQQVGPQAGLLSQHEIEKLLSESPSEWSVKQL